MLRWWPELGPGAELVRLERKAARDGRGQSNRAGHFGRQRQLQVVAVQMQLGGLVCREGDFDRVALGDADDVVGRHNLALMDGDGKLSDRRVWPAIDISQSGTRREEKLLDPDTLHAVTMLRRTLAQMHHVDAMEQLTKQLGKFKANRDFIKLIAGAQSAID